MVDTINSILDALNEKPTIQIWWNEMEIKDIKQYTSLDITLPYKRSILISDLDALKELSMEFNLPYEISKTITGYLADRIIPNLNIHFEESRDVKDIAISQGEISLEDLEKSKKNATSKKWWKKKDGATKSTRSATKKDSWTSKGRVRKRKS